MRRNAATSRFNDHAWELRPQPNGGLRAVAHHVFAADATPPLSAVAICGTRSSDDEGVRGTMTHKRRTTVNENDSEHGGW